MGALEDFLNAQQGDSSGLTGAQQGGLPSMAPPAPMAPQSPQMPPVAPPPPLGGSQPTSAPQQPPGPQMTGVKGYLANILYGMGEAAKKHAGLPTDQELYVQKQEMALKQQQSQSDIAYKQAAAQQFQMSPATAEEATAWGVPMGMPLTQKQRSDLAVKALQNTGKTDVADIRNTGATTVQGLKNQGKPPNPIVEALAAAKKASDAGDTEEFTKQINLAHQLASAKSVAPSNEIGLIMRANNGDQDAQKALDVLQQRRDELVNRRGTAMGQGRLWQLQTVMNPVTGETQYRSGWDILEAQKRGEQLIPTGKLPQDKVIAVQQLQSEAAPALKQVRDALPAFDNASDRAIFARVMHSAGSPARGDEAGWLGTVMDQAMKEGLSPDGQKLAMAEGRLAETLGRMRGVLGLQATDSAMALTLRLMPGASTPNSKYAGSQLDTLDNMIQKAVEIPAFGGKNKGGMGGAPAAPAPTNRPPLSSFEKR